MMRMHRGQRICVMTVVLLGLVACSERGATVNPDGTADVTFQVDLRRHLGGAALSQGSDVVRPQGIADAQIDGVFVSVRQNGASLKFDSSGQIDPDGTELISLLDEEGVVQRTLQLPIGNEYVFDLSVQSPEPGEALVETAWAQEVRTITGATSVSFPSLRSLTATAQLLAVGSAEIVRNGSKAIYLQVFAPGSNGQGGAPIVPLTDSGVTYSMSDFSEAPAVPLSGSQRGVLVTYDGASDEILVEARLSVLAPGRNVDDPAVTIRLSVVDQTDGVTIDADWTPPVVSITNPGDGTSIAVDQLVSVSGTATDDTSVSRVVVYDDLELLGEATLVGSNWSLPWTPTTLGPRSLYAFAYDESNNQAAALATVTVIQAIPDCDDGDEGTIDFWDGTQCVNDPLP
jgi:hypothetical protein